MIKVKLKKRSIETILVKKNMSQNWLAGKLGISSAYMSQLLNGKRTMSPEMRIRFQNYFKHHSYDDLFEIMK